MRRQWLIVGSILMFGFVTGGAATAEDAHDHGSAELDLAIDGGDLTLRFATPLNDLVGFERPPRNAEERARVEQVAARWLRLTELIQLTPEADCVPRRIQIASPLLDAALLGESATGATAPTAVDASEAHGDLIVEARFACAHPQRLGDLVLDLFDAFPGIERVRLRLVGPRGQAAATLTPADPRHRW